MNELCDHQQSRMLLWCENMYTYVYYLFTLVYKRFVIYIFKAAEYLQEFFDSQSGHTIWLRSAQAYHIDSSGDPDPVSFAWISEAARTRGETAIGVMTREGEV